jgi:hypothetical protein
VTLLLVLVPSQSSCLLQRALQKAATSACNLRPLRVPLVRQYV